MRLVLGEPVPQEAAARTATSAVYEGRARKWRLSGQRKQTHGGQGLSLPPREVTQAEGQGSWEDAGGSGPGLSVQAGARVSS